MNFDELDYVETAILLEKKLALPVSEGGAFQVVEIPDDDMADWKTLQDVVDTVVKVTAPGYGRLP